MKVEILRKARHWAVECNHGETHYVPSNVVSVSDNWKDGARFEPGNTFFEIIASTLREYVPSEPEAIEVTKPGYLGRYSMPGYLDCTDWEFSTSLRKLQASLRAMHGD